MVLSFNNRAVVIPEFMRTNFQWSTSSVPVKLSTSTSPSVIANAPTPTSERSEQQQQQQQQLVRASNAVVHSTAPAPVTDLTIASTALARYVDATNGNNNNNNNGNHHHTSNVPSSRYELVTRYSDEDSNQHVTHWRYAEFFQDALVHYG